MNKHKICQVLKQFNPIRFKHCKSCICSSKICKLDFRYIDGKTNKVKIVNLKSKWVKLSPK